MKPLLASLAALGPARLAALAGVGVATLGLLLFLAMRLSADGPMALLYGDLDLRDASAMADLLDKAHVPHEIGAGGSSILVPADRVAQARLDMARAGLPGGGSIGYEIFDRGDGLTTSQFQQDINETRALEGELARSIRIMRGVRGVRVHLVLARHEPFAQEQQQAQASVLLTMSGAARMDRDGVQAVLNLVAAAVPGLKPQNIAIVDDRGELLARAGEPSDGAAASQDELRMAAQTRLSHAVEEMLERSLGIGHVRAEAAVDMDFDHTSETDEKYDPDGQVARSTQSVTDSSKSSQKDTPVSVQNNLPNPDSGAGGSGSQDQHKEETTNYEIGKTVRTIVHDQPRIGRITLAVMVDGLTSLGADGKPAWHERSPDELARIATLARSVIGFDEKRGDKVEVVSMRFTDETASLPPAAAGLFGFTFGTGDIMRLVQMALFGIVALVVVLVVLRPAALKLATSPAARLAAEQAESGGATMDDPKLIGASPGPAGLLTDESMVSLGNVDGAIRASSIRRIAELVDKHPDESVAILRGWIAQEVG
jgi:flagellar M-ring protein FliF